MNEEIFKSFFPDDYNLRFLQHGIRNDSRKFDQIRKVEIYTKINGQSLGSSMIKLGKTIAMCSIEGTLTKKAISKIVYASEKTQPQKYIDLQLILGKNEEYENSKKGKFSKESFLSSWMNKMLDLAFPDLIEKLSVPSANSCWKLNAVIKVINDDGNIYDAAFLALLTGVLTTKLPKLKENLKGDDKIEIEKDQFIPIAFDKKNILFPATFRMIDTYILIDPNHDEENVEGSNFTLILNTEGEFMISKWSSHTIDSQKLSSVVDLATKRSSQFFKIIEAILDKNFQNKIVMND